MCWFFPEPIYTLGLHSSPCNELHNLIMGSVKYFLLSVLKILPDNSIGVSYCEEQQVITCLSTPSVILWIYSYTPSFTLPPKWKHPRPFRLLLILKLFYLCQCFQAQLYLSWGRIARTRTNIQDPAAPEVYHRTFCIVLFFPLPHSEPFTCLFITVSTELIIS